MIGIDLNSFRVVLLGTDLLLLVLMVGAVAFFSYASSREYYRAAWRQLRSKRLALVCMGVCLLYASTALLDSVHLQLRARDESLKRQVSEDGHAVYSNEVVSLLDLLFSRLSQSTENSFSAPFATHQFTRESLQVPGVGLVRENPRLRYGGAHLENPKQRARDLASLVLKGSMLGLGAGALILVCVLGTAAILGRKRDSVRGGHSSAPGLGVGLFLGVTTLAICVVGVLATRYHVLGTDQVGQDVLYRSLKGARVGLILGTITTLIATPLAILFGIAAAYIGGRVDDLIQYLYTTIDSIPDILRIAAMMLIVTSLTSGTRTVVASDTRLLWLCAALGVGSWTGLCRLLRGETLKIREIEFIQAAEAFGVGRLKIMFRHILPSVMHIVLITIVLRFSGLVLAEAVLAYVGIGVDPSMESWGNMINAARLDISRDPAVWWNLAAAFLFMFGLVLPANIFGDAVRDALDPKLKAL